MVEPGEAAPQRDVNLLEEIPAPVWIRLVGARQPFQRTAELPRDVGIEIRLPPW